jgi:hypothetical protein
MTQFICLKFIISDHWKSAIGAERILVSLMLVNIHRKEKCVQNVMSLFIGLLITKMMRLLKLNSMMAVSNRHYNINIGYYNEIEKHNR